VTAAELDAWILETAPRAVAYARSLLRNHADAEDVVQDCYCRLIAKQKDYDLANDGVKLLMRSITNACINQRTRRKPFARLISRVQGDDVNIDPLDTHAVAPAEHLQHAELNAAVKLALQTLPTQQRAAVELKSLGHSQQEVAEILGITPSNAGVLIHRARQTLSELLAPHLRTHDDA
jgi:RNA polymerase sigma-70 factor, ECF subfamily